MAKTEAIEWLKAGYADIRAIEYIVDDEFLTHIVAFHAQQTVEKSIKAILENENKRVPKVHKLQNLITRIDIDILFDSEIIEILDELYIDSRYPGDMGLLPQGRPALDDAHRFYEFAMRLHSDICGHIGVSRDEIS